MVALAAALAAIQLVPITTVVGQVNVRFGHEPLLRWLTRSLLEQLWNQVRGRPVPSPPAPSPRPAPCPHPPPLPSSGPLPSSTPLPSSCPLPSSDPRLQTFWLFSVSMLLLVPFAYFYHEAEDFGRKGWLAKLYEAATVLALVSAILYGLAYFLQRLLQLDGEHPIAVLHLVASVVGALLLLAVVPRGLRTLLAAIGCGTRMGGATIGALTITGSLQRAGRPERWGVRRHRALRVVGVNEPRLREVMNALSLEIDALDRRLDGPRSGGGGGGGGRDPDSPKTPTGRSGKSRRRRAQSSEATTTPPALVIAARMLYMPYVVRRSMPPRPPYHAHGWRCGLWTVHRERDVRALMHMDADSNGNGNGNPSGLGNGSEDGSRRRIGGGAGWRPWHGPQVLLARILRAPLERLAQAVPASWHLPGAALARLLRLPFEAAQRAARQAAPSLDGDLDVKVAIPVRPADTAPEAVWTQHVERLRSLFRDRQMQLDRLRSPYRYNIAFAVCNALVATLWCLLLARVGYALVSVRP